MDVHTPQTVSTKGGHVFLIRGKIESVVHDAAVLPTSDAFAFRPYWFPIVKERHPRALEPEGWPGNGVGRARDGQPLWFVSVGSHLRLGPDEVVRRALVAVEAVAQSDLATHNNRTKKLVALPIFGIEGGGHGGNRGELIERLLEGLDRAVQEHDIDIAVVTPDAAVYAAAQHVRAGLGHGRLTDRDEDEARRLGKLARDGELALFLGAGVSIPAGLPSWPQLITGVQGDGAQDLTGLSVLDQAQLLRKTMPDLGRRVASIIERVRRPSLAHALLAGLGCREAVTTNYDRLYEQAVDAAGEGVASILPWQDPTGARRWILKLHGDVKYVDSIVLTRRDFVRFDSVTRPAGALLQTLLMTRHLLLVGASLNDDNVVRLAHEVSEFRSTHELPAGVGTLLDVDADKVRQALWDEELTWLAMPGSTLAERARGLEVFLDRVAHHATKDTSWMLDERFASLLPADERALAEQARALAHRLGDASSPWASLHQTLKAMGAG